MFITISFILILCFIDKLLEYGNIEGRYYFNHFIINSFTTYQTYNDVLLSYYKISNYYKFSINTIAVEYTFAIHIYHIIMYYHKFLFDDWLHHIVMVLFTLPMGLYFDCGPLMGHCIFFSTGLPGGINYLLLFLQRNKLIKKKTQKYVNYHLNLWIRQPGCISSALLSTIFLIHEVDKNSIINIFFSLYIIFSNYWNGIYFMEQVVRNYNIKYN